MGVTVQEGLTETTLATFKDDCRAYNPSDLMFKSAETGDQFLKSDQQSFRIGFGNYFKLRGCGGDVISVAEEDIFQFSLSANSKYVIRTPDEKTKLLESADLALWDTRIEYEDSNGVKRAEAFSSFGDRLAQGYFCNGGYYEVTFDRDLPQLERLSVVALTA